MYVPVLANVNVQTGFEVPSFTHSKDMIGAPKFKMGHMTLTTPLSGVVYHA